MPQSLFEPCIPTRGTKVPDRPEWIHEVKHDGYRLIVQREGQRVRLFTRNGHDWSGRFPLISEAALRNRNSAFVIDGEAVLLGVDGRSDFNGLHSRKHDAEVEFYAFDMLVSDGEDIRKLPLSMRKTNLSRLLARRVDGIHLAPFEQGEKNTSSILLSARVLHFDPTVETTGTIGAVTVLGDQPLHPHQARMECHTYHRRCIVRYTAVVCERGGV